MCAYPHWMQCQHALSRKSPRTAQPLRVEVGFCVSAEFVVWGILRPESLTYGLGSNNPRRKKLLQAGVAMCSCRQLFLGSFLTR